MRFCSSVVFLAIVLFFSAAAPAQQVSDSAVTWVAPAARVKAWMPFAPKPSEGDNIFKGEAEKWLADAIEKLEAGSLRPIKDKAVSDYVTKVGNNLAKYSAAPTKQFEFIVLDDSEPNAMTAGGGRIYINLGMLQLVESEDELAGVLGHELGHDIFGHAPKTVTRQLFWMKGIRKVKSAADVEAALKSLDEAYEKHLFAAVGEALLGFQRLNETEADRAGFYNMYKAGYNPEALKERFNKWAKEAKAEQGDNYNFQQFLTILFGSHPPDSHRATALSWESNWIKMPPKSERFKSAAFDAMKDRVGKL
jgi:predicted Zn-dependent protease